MDIWDKLKKEYKEGPLALGISILTLVIVLFGSPFAKGSWLNPIVPRVAVVSETIEPNTTDYMGKFLISVEAKNLKTIPTQVAANAILLNSEGKRIQILNDLESGRETIIEIEPSVEVIFRLTTNEIPAFISICLDSEARGLWAESRFEGRYYLPYPANEITSIKTYVRAQGSVFSDKSITACS